MICDANIHIKVPCNEPEVDAYCIEAVWCELPEGHDGKHTAAAPTDQSAELTWGEETK